MQRSIYYRGIIGSSHRLLSLALRPQCVQSMMDDILDGVLGHVVGRFKMDTGESKPFLVLVCSRFKFALIFFHYEHRNSGGANCQRCPTQCCRDAQPSAAVCDLPTQWQLRRNRRNMHGVFTGHFGHDIPSPRRAHCIAWDLGGLMSQLPAER